MSHPKNKVEWCLKKAERELREKDKHRGLVKIKPSEELIDGHIKKAEKNIQAIRDFYNQGYEDWALSAAFYSIYHAFLAILSKFGYESGNQECTISVIEMLIEDKKIELDKKFVNALKESQEKSKTVIELRENYQYGIDIKIGKDANIDAITAFCKEAVLAVKKVLYNTP